MHMQLAESFALQGAIISHSRLLIWQAVSSFTIVSPAYPQSRCYLRLTALPLIRNVFAVSTQ
jgi:hypothetical protein